MYGWVGAGRSLPHTRQLTPHCEIGGLALFWRYRNLHVLGAVLLVPSFQRIGPRRQSLYCKRPVVACHGEKWMGYNADVGAHPRVYVALHRDHDLFAREALGLRIALGRLRFVPLLIDL